MTEKREWPTGSPVVWTEDEAWEQVMAALERAQSWRAKVGYGPVPDDRDDQEDRPS